MWVIVKNQLRISESLIKPLVGGIEFRQHDDQYGHFSDRSVSDEWRNHDALVLADRYDLPIELHLRVRFAFEKNVCLCQRFMIMPPSVFADFGDMKCTGKLVDALKRAACLAAWAWNRGDVRKVCMLPATMACFRGRVRCHEFSLEL